MDAVEEAFYYAEGDEAAHVDACEERHVFEHPVAQAETLAQRGVESDECRVGDDGDFIVRGIVGVG